MSDESPIGTWEVQFWGSDPDLNNDDFWSSIEGAEAQMRAIFDAADVLPREDCYGDDRPSLSTVLNTATLVLARLSSYEDDPIHGRVPHYEIMAKRSNPHFCPPPKDDDWMREQAMEAGMAFGCDGYNDAMGW